MRYNLLVGMLISCLLTAPASSETPFEACNLRFLDGMSCVKDACGPMGVLDLPASQFCEPRPCDQFLSRDDMTAGLEYSWCVEDYEALGGKLDSLGRPQRACEPNPDYPAAKAEADQWLACQESVWTQCDGDFVDKYLVDGGFDILACRKDFTDGTLPPR